MEQTDRDWTICSNKKNYIKETFINLLHNWKKNSC